MATAAGWREIDEQVYVRRHDSYDLNVGLVVGDGACLVIDSRETLRAGREVADAVRQVTSVPWTVLNTHAHVDHYLGNEAFLPTDIWALARCRDVIERYGDVHRMVTAHLLREAGEDETADDLAASPIVLPTHTFEPPTHRLDIGRRTVTLRHLGRGHTDNDVVVTIAGCRALFAGDLVEEGAPPAFEDSFPMEWVSTLDALLDLVDGPVVPGHGDVVDDAFVREQQALHALVADAARTGLGTVAGLPDDVADTALRRARAQLDGTLAEPSRDEILARFGLS